jgi:PAS domain S-box-containing protein
MTEILVVEDSPTQAEKLKQVLETHAYAVTTAPGGEAALERMQFRKPGIVLSDVLMPGMDGYALCKRIRGDAGLRDIPFILLTSLSDPEDVLKGLECGADGFITKPFDEEHLVSRLEQTLRNSGPQAAGLDATVMEVVFAGRRHSIAADRSRILNFLISTYETAILRNRELARTRDELKQLNHQLDERVRERTGKLLAEIADRKRAEAALRRSEERFSKAFHSSPTPMAITRARDGVFIDINERNLRMLGYAREEIIGRNTLEMGIIDIEQRRTIYSSMLERGSLRDYQAEIRTKAGETRVVLISMEAIDLGGEASFLTTSNDITERRRVEEQLRQAQKMEAIGHLAGGIAHDFNNLLTVILGHVQMLIQNGRMDPESRDSLNSIFMAADRAGNLTRQLLAFSRKQALIPQVLDLNNVIADMARLLERVIGENIILTTLCPAGLPAIHADRGMLEQVILNLVVNARDAMPRGGRLTLRSERMRVDAEYARNHSGAREGNFVCLGVSDTGTGMPEEILSHLFEPFFTTKEAGKGTGLGLATVYGIVQQHQGWIDVRSQVGVGTDFRIFLPECGNAALHPEPGRAQPHLSRGSETLLVVEGDSTLRQLVRAHLEELGYHVLEAASGREAEAVWTRHSTDISLLLTDLVVPDGPMGRNLAEKLRQDKPELKIILTTGNGANSAPVLAAMQPQPFLLQKPYQLRKLAQAVRHCLDTADPALSHW